MIGPAGGMQGKKKKNTGGLEETLGKDIGRRNSYGKNRK